MLNQGIIFHLLMIIIQTNGTNLMIILLNKFHYNKFFNHLSVENKKKCLHII